MIMRIRAILLTSFFLIASCAVQGQQLVIMKKGNVTTRFNSGDELVFVMKNDKQPNRVIIQSIREFYFITTGKDTIQFQKVGKILFRNPERKKYGAGVFAAGAIFLGVWGVNSLAFDTSSPSMRGLRFIGFVGVGVGAFIYFTANSKIVLKGATRLKYISYDSPLYR